MAINDQQHRETNHESTFRNVQTQLAEQFAQSAVKNAGMHIQITAREPFYNGCHRTEYERPIHHDRGLSSLRAHRESARRPPTVTPPAADPGRRLPSLRQVQQEARRDSAPHPGPVCCRPPATGGHQVSRLVLRSSRRTGVAEQERSAGRQPRMAALSRTPLPADIPLLSADGRQHQRLSSLRRIALDRHSQERRP